jgi:RND family efflux transporter MFP subunit
MKKVGGILVVLALAYFIWSSVAPDTMSLRKADVDLPTTRLSRGTIAVTTVATGFVQPKVGAEVRVGSRLSGIVKKLNVNVGDEVERGEILATLDDAELVAGIAEAMAGLVLATAELEFAEDELRRMVTLGDLVPDFGVQEARKAVAVRAAQVELQKASLEKIEIRRSYAEIVAPISGTIASVSTYEGETVAASFAAPTFMVIVDLNRLEVQAYIDETDIGRVYVGQSVSFTIDAYPRTELTGSVRAVLPKANIVNNVVNYVATVDIEAGAEMKIRPEMTTRLHFVLDERQDVLTIARRSLLRSGGETHVIRRDGEEWKKQTVEIGLMNSERVEVLSGLDEGDVIVADKQKWNEWMEEQK